MKIRLDYITNSSSSSFVIIVREVELSETDRKILDLVLDYCLGETEEKECLNSEIMEFNSSRDRFTISDDIDRGDYHDLSLEYLRKEIEKGALVYAKNISYLDEDFLLTILKKCLTSKVSLTDKIKIYKRIY